MMQVIPKLNYRLGQIVLVAKSAQAGSAQQEISAGSGFQPKPTCGEYAEKVPARKDQDVLLDRTNAVNDTIRSRSNVAG